MLAGVIQKKTLQEIAASIESLETGLYDLLELRLDGCRDLTPEGLARLRPPLPCILTLRAASEGGAYAGSEEERLDMLERLAALRPAYLDVEAFVPAERIARIRAVSPETRLILSAHDFFGTPDDLEAVLENMRAKAAGAIYKIAALARNTPEALRMLLLCKTAGERGLDVIGIGMGEYGECTRVLAPVFHYGLSYCPAEQATAPGQIDAATLRDTYNFRKLNRNTAVYGLLGDPVAQSAGHVYHNRRNAESGLNAVYVKWRVGKEDLAESLRLLAALGVRGGSVTMPLKEAVLAYLSGVDEGASAVGAVNTLKLAGGGYAGTNTDAAGALDALPMPVGGLELALIGAGGAARAVVYEALARGAKVSVYNRSVGKSLPGGLETLPFDRLFTAEGRHCDILINTLPFASDFDFSRVPFNKKMFAYDLSYAKKSRFLDLAAAAGCRTLDGSGMFEAQARLQRRFWFGRAE